MQLVAKQKARTVWIPPKAGLKFTRLRQKKTQPPTSTATRRGLQLKSLARQFSARTGEGEARRQSSTRELRLLPKPIYRYKMAESEQNQVLDGAVFAFVANGGNPEAMLIIEAIPDSSGSGAYWQYAFSRRTIGELTGFHQKQEVWSVPSVRPSELRSTAAFHKIRLNTAQSEGDL